jgi:hypothetical protein
MELGVVAEDDLSNNIQSPTAIPEFLDATLSNEHAQQTSSSSSTSTSSSSGAACELEGCPRQDISGMSSLTLGLPTGKSGRSAGLNADLQESGATGTSTNIMTLRGPRASGTGDGDTRAGEGRERRA